MARGARADPTQDDERARSPQGENATTMTLRNSGRAERLLEARAPLMSVAMRGANRKDLRLLKSILENA